MNDPLKCPGCGHPFDNEAVLSLAPVCPACGRIFIIQGGMQGLTAIPHEDAALRRDELEGAIQGIQKTLARLNGALEQSNRQLEWSAMDYAKKKWPQRPELLEVENVPSHIDCIISLLNVENNSLIICFSLLLVFATITVPIIMTFIDLTKQIAVLPECFVFFFSTVSIVIYAMLATFIVFSDRIRAIKNNGEIPKENKRREQLYNKSCIEAVKQGEKDKIAEDYQIRLNIRKIESDIEVVEKRKSELENFMSTIKITHATVSSTGKYMQ